jgi:hypothetical protein
LWCRNKLQQHLAAIDPELSDSTTDLSDLFPDCDEPAEYRVALLKLSGCTEFLGSVRQGKGREVLVRERDDDGNIRKTLLTIDKTFHNLTPLNEPKDPITAELV